MKIPVWALAVVPLMSFVIGFTSNALVLRANQQQMPVMVNSCTAKVFDDDVMIAKAPLHTCMTPQTHLNWLADWVIIRGKGIASPGDFLEWSGELAFWPAITGLIFLKLDERGVFKH